MKYFLNRMHGVKYSLLYWRIVIGPWLYYFIQILYDRYQSILTAIKSGKVTDTLVDRYDEARWLSQDFLCFLNCFATDDYNHHIYSRIIEFTGRMPFNVVEAMDRNNQKKQIYRTKNHFVHKRILIKLAGLYGKFVPNRFNQIALILCPTNSIKSH
jgi:putative transferase (TIGR04331 family)